MRKRAQYEPLLRGLAAGVGLIEIFVLVGLLLWPRSSGPADLELGVRARADRGGRKILTAVMAPQVEVTIPEPTPPPGPLHIEDLLCPLSPRGPEGCITQGFHGGHRGIDISLWGGTPITATHAGIAVCAGWVGGDFGNLIIIRSEGDPPEWESWYGHLSQVIVRQGREVEKGELIGLSGNTGEVTTGAHLHYEIHRLGEPVDPLELP